MLFSPIINDLIIIAIVTSSTIIKCILSLKYLLIKLDTTDIGKHDANGFSLTGTVGDATKFENRSLYLSLSYLVTYGNYVKFNARNAIDHDRRYCRFTNLKTPRELYCRRML